MSFMSVFPTLVGLLDLGAAIVYFQKGEMNLAVTWLCYAIAAYALGGVK